MPRDINTTPPPPRRDVGKEIDQAQPDPQVARRAAEDIERHSGAKTTQDELEEDLVDERSGDPSVHQQVFGRDAEKAYDDTPPGAGHREVNPIGTAVQPEGFSPMRGVGDTDQGDRQPDGGRRR
ncbi:MAG TPA: hypothetical protein VIA80_14855 [Hyphomonadaceae bacterium]|jgi:hypothetical protein